MEYMNPGYAAGQALKQFLLDRDTEARQTMLDQLKMQEQQLRVEEYHNRIKQQAEDRQQKQFEDKVANLMPGDVPDRDLMAEGRRIGMPLPTKIQADGSGEQGPMPGGDDPLGTERVYLGSPQYRMQQMAAREKQDAATARGTALSSAAEAADPQEAFRIALESGATVAEATSIAKQVAGQGAGDMQPVVRINPRTGKIETLGEAPKGAHFVTQPPPVNVNVGQGGMDNLSDSALTFMAERVLAGGDEPAFGSGTQGAIARQKFATKLAELAAARGLSGDDLAKIRMRYKADSSAAGQLAKTFETTEAFSDTARANLGLLNDALDKIPDSNISFVNAVTRGFGRMTGNADISAFDTYRRSVANEFARIISQANGGVLTDSARKETDELVNPNASVAQIRRSISALEAEAANRTTQYGNRLNELAPRAPSGSAPAAPTGGGSFKVKSVRPAGK